jgi:F420-0:gamma-glutamyl ligase-like protein
VRKLGNLKRYKFRVVETALWKPYEDYLTKTVNALEGASIGEAYVVVISEKAVSVAAGRTLDESAIAPGLMARLLAKYWMRIVWGYLLGPLCHLRSKTIHHLRKYPTEDGAAHKQVTLNYCNFLQSLMHSSEGGVDGSNLPHSLVSLPLSNAQLAAERLRQRIKKDLGKDVVVVIADSDRTYSWRNFHFTPRPGAIDGIKSAGGVLAYIVGRALKLKRRSTPVALAGASLHVEEVLEIAELANRVRGFGAGRTVWDMAKAFGVELTNVTWKMLEEVTHRPIVLVKPAT